MKTEKECLEALARLGNDSNTIAANLVRLGIKGNRNSCRTCPIAKYLLSCGAPNVNVGNSIVIYDSANESGTSNITVSIDVPDVIFDFITQVDLGAYPQLNV